MAQKTLAKIMMKLLANNHYNKNELNEDADQEWSASFIYQMSQCAVYENSVFDRV